MAKFLAANPDFHVVEPEQPCPGRNIGPLGTLFVAPQDRTDGFLCRHPGTKVTQNSLL